MLVPRSTVPVGAKVLLICTAYLIFSQTEKEPGSFLLPNRVIITRGIIFMPAYCAIPQKSQVLLDHVLFGILFTFQKKQTALHQYNRYSKHNGEFHSI